MSEREHFQRLNRYYDFSRWEYNFLLGGSKHFGFYPDEKWIPTKKAQQLMQDLVAEKLNLRKGMRVLDAGCGQGVTSTYLAQKHGCSIDGITVVPFEIEEATRLAKKLEVPERTHYALMDYSQLKFGNETFDAIYTQESLVHSTNIQQTLKEFYRVLKRGGRIALFEYSMAENDKFSPEELRTIEEMNYASAMHSFSVMRHGTLETLMRDEGFRDVKVENISYKVAPMIRMYEKFSKPVYFVMRFLGLTATMPNLVAAARMRKFGERDLVRYNIFTAQK